MNTGWDEDHLPEPACPPHLSLRTARRGWSELRALFEDKKHEELPEAH
jgi:hypothetical protein